MKSPTLLVVSLTMLFAMAPAAAQGRPDAARLVAAQQAALAKLAFMDGSWRGTAVHSASSGEKHTITQTERVGPFLDGAIRVIEGRGYAADGTLAFNSFGTISFNPATASYSLRSHAMGTAGDFALIPADNGFSWEIPAGPMVIRYTATIVNGVWTEVGDRIAPGKAPVRFFEMTLNRIGDTDWPVAGAIGPR